MIRKWKNAWYYIQDGVIVAVLAALLATMVLMMSGCQWSSYNTVTTAPDGTVTKTGIGTIEFLVFDSKDNLVVKLKDGTVLTLGSTSTEPDKEAIQTIVQTVLQTMAVL
jgi:hypothetical protein